ncbi:hypothetical protein ACVWXO_008550 [Bradyrhizobium sp. LM2.7]
MPGKPTTTEGNGDDSVPVHSALETKEGALSLPRNLKLWMALP